MPLSRLTHPFVLAALATLANAAKPVTVDDTAYILYARHIAEHPADPYGFFIFWWAKPEPAMDVLAPPVVPYWLALGVRLFGESPALLKLWLFPFIGLLAWSLRALLRRFARGAEDFALPLLILSPAVLPTINLMLDIPAVALALAAVEVFIRTSGRRDWRGVILVGVVAAFAMQTKYTAFVAPAVFAWYGLTHRQFALAFGAASVCVALFAGWELLLVEKYGRSHFWTHASGSGGAPPEGANRVTAFLHDKFDLIPPLVGQLGCLATGVGLLAASALRVPRKWLAGVAVTWLVGFALVCTLPHRWTAASGNVTATATFWQASGWCWLAASAGCATVMLFRVKRGLAPRLSADAWFVAGWLAIEIAASVILTPFPAARRVIGVTLVAGLLAARAASRVRRANPARRAPRWVLVAGVLGGALVAGIDAFDSLPEKFCAERAAEVTRGRPETSTAWYVGHWGFQYYCERAGMKPLVPGETRVRVGDFVVLPKYPDGGFHRPYAGFDVREPFWIAEDVAVVEWDDWLSAQTVPNFYGGLNPIVGRDYPRLRVRVVRLLADWNP